MRREFCPTFQPTRTPSPQSPLFKVMIVRSSKIGHLDSHTHGASRGLMWMMLPSLQPGVHQPRRRTIALHPDNRDDLRFRHTDTIANFLTMMKSLLAKRRGIQAWRTARLPAKKSS